MSLITKPIMLDETGQTSVQRLSELNTKMQLLAEAIESVHSVNGMTGDVVIDASNIKTNKLDPGSKTVKQAIDDEQSAVNSAVSSMQQAISRTPVHFSTTQIEDEDYLLTITLGTP